MLASPCEQAFGRKTAPGIVPYAKRLRRKPRPVHSSFAFSFRFQDSVFLLPSFCPTFPRIPFFP